MKRSPGDDERYGRSADSQAEDILTRFLRRNPKFFIYVGIGLGALVLITIGIILFTGKGR